MKKPGSHDSPGMGGGKPKAEGARIRRPGGAVLPLDPEVERWFAAVGAAFPASRSSIIPMLQSAQASLGYLPRDAMQAIARHLKVSPVTLEGVASFYAQFRFDKPGRHRVTVCRGTACYVRGSSKLMDDIQADLKVAAGGTTADGEVTLEAVSCFGACALAPVVVVDGTVNGRVSSASLKALVDAAGQHPQPQPGRRTKAGA